MVTSLAGAWVNVLFIYYLLDAMNEYLISTSSVELVSQIATEVFITIDEAVFYRVIFPLVIGVSRLVTSF